MNVISAKVAGSGDDLVHFYPPDVVVKRQTLENNWLRNFTMKSLSELVGNEEERRWCPVKESRFYLDKSSQESRPRALYVSVRRPNRHVRECNVMFFLEQ